MPSMANLNLSNEVLFSGLVKISATICLVGTYLSTIVLLST